MTEGRRTSVDLSAEDVVFVEQKVASGSFQSASDVVHAGLTALREREQGLDDWIRAEVVPAYDRLKADPSRAAPIEEGFARLRARYADRRSKKE